MGDIEGQNHNARHRLNTVTPSLHIVSAKCCGLQPWGWALLVIPKQEKHLVSLEPLTHLPQTCLLNKNQVVSV